VVRVGEGERGKSERKGREVKVRDSV